MNDAKEWFTNNFNAVKRLFEDYTLRDYVFEPFAGVFKLPTNTINQDIYAIITQVAIINAVLAGLPGQMGVGIYVSMALEAWMAYAIAKHVGIQLHEPSDVFKYFGLLGSVALAIGVLFKHMISFVFSISSTVIPFINPLIVAEIVVTNFIGVLFWVGFTEAKNKGSFTIPLLTFKSIITKTKEIFMHQFEFLKDVLTIENIKLVGSRLKSWLNGDLILEQKKLNGDLFATAAMGYLMSGHYEKLDGPLGNTFIEAIRLRWSEQLGPDATLEEITDVFKGYDAEQLSGAINTIKGKMFEIMVTNAENANDDAWHAHMHTDESYPGSDIIFTNTETGEELEVSLKAVSGTDGDIIEKALDKYPDLPILTTHEAAQVFDDNPQIFDSNISNEDLKNITEEQMDKLLNSIESLDATHVTFQGTVVSMAALAWPFTMAYFRKRISYESYQKAMGKILGGSGVKLASRVSYALILGPIFAWYLLARGVGMIFRDAANAKEARRMIVSY